MRAKLRRSRRRLLFTGCGKNGTVDSRQFAVTRIVQVNKSACGAHLRIFYDLFQFWQWSPFDVSLLEEDPPFGEIARFELRLENGEQRRRILCSGLGGRKQGVSRQFLLAERPAEIGKFYLRIKQHNHEYLAVAAQIPCRQRIGRSAVCAALGKLSAGEFGLQVARIRPRPTR